MNILALLYWVILVLAIVFNLVAWNYGPRVGSLAVIALFILIGLKLFRIPLQ